MRTRVVLGGALAALCAAGCATTKVVATWRDPGASAVAFHKVLVVATVHDEVVRRNAEDELASRFRAAVAVPSYQVLPSEQIHDREAIRRALTDGGFDGLAVLRVVNVEQRAAWAPGVYWGPSYAFGGWPIYDPGYLRVDTIVRIETDVYTAPDEKLVWASTTRTLDPGSVKRMLDSVARTVTDRMRREGLVV